MAVYNNTEAYAFYRSGNGSGFWNSTSLNGAPVGVGSTSESITIFSNTEAYAFYRSGNGSGFWNSTSLNGTPIGIIGSN